jgi:cysteine synthase A
MKKAEELHGQIVGSYIPGQFENPVNVDVHRKTTGPEIWRDTEGRVDILVAGVGTGGTITGVGEYLRTKNPKLQIVAVEPERSPFLTEQRAGAHGIYGIGAGFWPKLLNRSLYNEVITVKDDEAREWAEWMARQEGLLVGISSGAAIAAAVRVAHRIDAEGKTMVVILPDGGERYFSTGLFQ